MEHDIKICTPYYNVIEEEVQQSIYSLLDSDRVNCAWKAIQGTNIANARNYLVNDGNSDRMYQELDTDFTHFLFLDSDIIITEYQLEKLINYDLDVVSMAYKSREHEYTYVGGLFKYNEKGDFLDALKLKSDSTGLMEVDWVGAGCLLVKKDVFADIEYPWFHYPVVSMVKDEVTHSKLIYEDVGFCMNLKDNDYRVYIDCDNEVKHLARNYNTHIANDLELLFKNVNDDVNKMFQLVRGMSYEIKGLNEKIQEHEDK